MRILTDKGHRAFLVGNQKFEDQDTVQIVVTGGKVRITNLSRTQNQKYVSLWDASLLGSEICGGKAHRLSTLKILGFQVPHGAVLTTLLFDSVIKALGYEPSISLSEFTDIHKLLENPSPEILEIIKSQLVDYQKSDRIFAVRSSATIEDDAQNSMAGMYDSFLNVSGDDLTGKVIQVIQSAFSIKIMNFLNENPDLIKKQKMAVIIQEMIPARCAGVIFGANVQSKDTDIVEIEAKEGLGEGIVSGEAKEIEQCKFSRSQRHIIEHKKPTILSSTEAKALFMLSERLRSEFNSPQDIEWAIDQNGQIWILQTRDLFLG